MINRIEIATKTPLYPDREGDRILAEAQELGINSIKRVRVVKVYKLEGNLTQKQLQTIINELLREKLWQKSALNTSVISSNNAKTIEISRKRGVMDTETDSILKAVKDLGVFNLEAVGTGKKYIFFGSVSPKELAHITESILMNAIVDRIVVKPDKTLHIKSRKAKTTTIPIRNMDDYKLMALSKDTLWLSLEEMRAIAKYFTKQRRDPTDIEIETIAQTWSEHCSHKTFNAKLTINGVKKSSFMSRLKKATKKLHKPWCLSVFKDNAGVIEFDKNFGICAKVETHNSPSAIEPYGGAMTGSGGVFRDIMGCGLGAHVLISTDIFCFAPPSMPSKQIPQGCIHPKRMLKEVVRGVRDYGNRMGIPTNNGSLHFHADYRAKPSIIVGAYGLQPKQFVHKKQLRPGDCIITVGGKTGRDGIHGVTFASASMSEHTESISSSAVQIGNAIEQKRMFDAILACRDKGLLRFVQDCGGGGYSSAIGEVAEHTGADVYLDRIPLKYSGLASWEMWISESQERMILIADPQDAEEIHHICANHNVEATNLGNITDTKRLRLYDKNHKECDLSMEFLHHGCPISHIQASYTPVSYTEPVLSVPKNYTIILKKLLSHGDICSKEPIVRQYDHEVQGTSVVKPFSGKHQDAPNDAVVISPILGEKKGMVVSHGLIPRYMKIDTYWGAAAAIDEAVRNLVCVGVDPLRIALVDNFIWPTPQDAEIIQLDRAIDACYDISLELGTPFVSGKDSLSSTYTHADGTTIKIPPTLCVSAFAPMQDVSKSITAGFKTADNHIYLLGETLPEMGGSAYYDLYHKLGSSVPRYQAKKALQLYKKIHKAIQKKLIISAHDISEGGLAVALAEMCFAGQGAQIDIENITSLSHARYDHVLFSESNARIIVEVPTAKKKEFETLMKPQPCAHIGKVVQEKHITITHQQSILVSSSINALKKAWKQPMRQIFS